MNKNSKKSFDQFTVADVSFKKAEQLVIYLKCLQLLKLIIYINFVYINQSNCTILSYHKTNGTQKKLI